MRDRRAESEQAMNRTDDELVALAAKAAGIDTRKPWNPLTNRADGMELLVKLNMQTGSNHLGDPWGCSWADCGGLHYYEVPHKGDAVAATCRAIVLVAASIGEKLP